MHEYDDHGDRDLNADQVIEDWDSALDAADDAVAASRRAGALPPSETKAESQRISEERRWLGGMRGVLRKFLPGARRGRVPGG